MSRSLSSAFVRLPMAAALVLALLAAMFAATLPAANAAPTSVWPPTSTGASDYNHDGNADALIVDTSGNLILYPGDGRGRFGASTVLGHGWLGYKIVTPGDFTGDGRSDLLGIAPDGSLHLYAGVRGGFSGKVKIGHGWQHFRHVFSPGDLSGDGRSDLVAIAQNGDMYLYRGSGTGRISGSSKIGYGWQVFVDVLPGGDFNGDGRADILAKDSSGRLFAYYGRGNSKLSARAQIGHGWSDYQLLSSVGDFNGDGVTDVLATMSSTGLVYLYPGTGRGSFGARTQVGTGWGEVAAPVADRRPAARPSASSYPGTTTIAFPTCPSTVVRHTGVRSKALYQANAGSGTWDLTGATFSDPAAYPYPIRSENWGSGCIVGGRFEGPIPKGHTRDMWYNGIGSPELKSQELRVTMNSPQSWLHYQGQYASDMEDVFDANGPGSTITTYVSNAEVVDVRDDCVESEKPVHNFYMNNSYLECFTAFAQRPSGSSSGNKGTAPVEFVVENSLVYSKPQPLGPQYCSDTHVQRGRCQTTGTRDVWLGAYGIWKWSDQAAATVKVRNTIFRLDTTSYSSCRAQEWPAGTYENVTVVWFDTMGQGGYANAGDCKNSLPAGVTLTTDTSVWTDAVAAWRAQW